MPRDEQLAITGSSRSPGLTAMIDIAAAAAPFTAASALLSDLAGVRVGAKTIERVAEADGLAAEAEQAARATEIVTGRLVPLPPTPTPGQAVPDMLYVAVDGTGVPLRASETLDRTGKGPDGRARTREVKLAALFTQTTTTPDGYRSGMRARSAIWPPSTTASSSGAWSKRPRSNAVTTGSGRP